MNTNSNPLPSRREFLKTTAVVGTALAAPAILPGNLFAKAKGYIIVYLPAYDKSGGLVEGTVQYSADQGASEITPCTSFCD